MVDMNQPIGNQVNVNTGWLERSQDQTPEFNQPTIDNGGNNNLKKYGTAVVAFGVVAGLAVAGKLLILDKDTTPANEGVDRPAVSATKTPGAIETSKAPLAQTIETVNITPSPEIVTEALRPITTAEFKTPEEALVRIGQVWNVQIISGIVNEDSFNLEETPESLDRREKLWETLYGDHIDEPQVDLTDVNHLRYNISRAMWYMKDPLKPGKYTGGVAPYWQLKFVPIAVKKNDEGNYDFKVRQLMSSNLGKVMEAQDLNRYFKNGMPSEYTQIAKGTLYIKDGVYTVDNIEVQSDTLKIIEP